MSNESKEELCEKFRTVLPTMLAMIREAKKEGKAVGGILGMNDFGGGKIIGNFEIEEFTSDLAKLVGYESDPAEEDDNFAADKVLAMFGQGPLGGKQ